MKDQFDVSKAIKRIWKASESEDSLKQFARHLAATNTPEGDIARRWLELKKSYNQNGK